jgi:Sulfatase
LPTVAPLGYEVKARWLLEAAGAALLLMLPDFCPLLVPHNTALYHHNLPLTRVGAGILVDLLGAFVLAAVLISVVSHLPPAPRRIVGACLAGFALWRGAALVFQLTHLWLSQLEAPGIQQGPKYFLTILNNWDRWGSWAGAGLPILLPVLAWLKPGFSRPVVNATRLGVAALSFSGLWIVPQLVYVSFLAHPANTQAAIIRPNKGSDKRIIWILFDELSYNLVIDHRPAGLTFPNFDKLHSKSFSFANVEPNGNYTERIIPSLLSGHPIEELRSNNDGGLWYLDPARHQWFPYDPGNSLFALAEYNGWNPGVVGWFNPYCRTFASVLTSCQWRPGIEVELPIEGLGASEQKSILANAMVVPRMFARMVLRRPDKYWVEHVKRNVEDYRSIMQYASNLIQNDQARFVFIHMPVPHPPGIYDRRTHTLVAHGNYLDNLVLADDSLGELMREIEKTASADQTTLIVSSDHSWRVPIWRLGGVWTREEEQISQGRFDTRPVLLIHFPGQNSGKEILAHMPELTEYDIVSAMLKLQMSAPENLDAFLQSRPQPREHADLHHPPSIQ